MVFLTYPVITLYSINIQETKLILIHASPKRSYLVLLDRRLHRQVPQSRRRLPARRDLRLGPKWEMI